MTVATYTTDLIDISTAETTTNWSALGGGGAGLSADTDFAIQGTYSLTKQVNNALKGMVYNNASVTIGTDDHFLIWLYATTPGLLDTLANGGMRVTLGTSTSAFVEFYVRGSAEYSEGGWICFPVKYQTTAPSPGRLLGSPGASPTHVGGELKTVGTVKAVNFGIDASRIGTGIDILYGTGADPVASLAAAADKNDLVANRWGILSNRPGGYSLQGKVRIGSSTVACELEEEGALIAFTDTPFTATDFTEILFDHASTIATFTSCTFLGLGTNNPGKITLSTANLDLTFESCTFKNMGAITAPSTFYGVFFKNSVFDNCGTVTAKGSAAGIYNTFKNCTASVALVVFTGNSISQSTFTSTGTGHAVEITSNTNNWCQWDNNKDTGYAATDGSTGNETIFVNVATGVLEIRLSGASTVPTIKTAGCVVTVVNISKTLVISVKDADGANVSGARVYVTATSGGYMTVGTVIINSVTTGTGVVFKVDNWEADQPFDVLIRAGTTAPFFREFRASSGMTFDRDVNLDYIMVDDE